MAYKDQSAVRALQRLPKSRIPSNIPPSALQPGDNILIFYRSPKQNEKDEWKTGRVQYPLPHFVILCTGKRGPPKNISYEDIKIRPDSDITRQLMEDDIKYQSPDEGETTPSTNTN